MEEIFQIADEITVFRDGKSVITKDVKRLDNGSGCRMHGRT